MSIKQKDVIWLLVPFPNINSGLAIKRHMYICKTSEHPQYAYAKCQTYKPELLYNGAIKECFVEYPNINHNPFKRATLVDCDKTFHSSGVSYGDELLTKTRRDVSDKVYDELVRALARGVHKTVRMNEDELCDLNEFVNHII